MDAEWDEVSHRKGSRKPGIKKLKDEWVWQPAKLGPADQYGSHQVGDLLKDEVYPCGFCSGTGEKPKGSKCPVCRGSSSVSIEPPAVKCAYCKGSGQEKPRSNITCTACRGKGVIPVQGPVERCLNCKGTGKEPNNKLVCVKCRGKGVVTVKEEEPLVREDVFSRFTEEPEERSVGSASGSERDALQVVKQLGKADSITVSKKMVPQISSAYTDKLCSSLVNKRLLIKEGVFYSPASGGEKE